MKQILGKKYDYVNGIDFIREEDVLDCILRLIKEFEENAEYTDSLKKIREGDLETTVECRVGDESVEVFCKHNHIDFGMEQHVMPYVTLRWWHTMDDNSKELFLNACVRPDGYVDDNRYVISTPGGCEKIILSKVILDHSPYTQNLGMCKNALLKFLKPTKWSQFELCSNGENEYYAEIFNWDDTWMDLSKYIFDGEFNGTNEIFRLWRWCTYMTPEVFTTYEDESRSVSISRHLSKMHLVSRRTLNPVFSDVIRNDIKNFMPTPSDIYDCISSSGAFGYDPIALFTSYHAKNHGTVAHQSAFIFALTYLVYAENSFRKGLFVHTIGPRCIELLNEVEYHRFTDYYKKLVNSYDIRDKKIKAKKVAKRIKEAEELLNCDLELD